MTFSLAARCPETGMFGIAITTSSIAVGNRCPWLRAGVGAVTTQFRSDIRIGPRGLDLLASGLSAREALDVLVRDNDFPQHRQIGVVDRQGGTAFHTGDAVRGPRAGAEGPGCVSVGNVVAHEGVPAATVAGYLAARGPFAERLLAAVEAGLAAGGETQPLMSAALLIADRESWPLVDLRVDFQEGPLLALRRLWTIYEPETEHYLTQVLRPDAVAPLADRQAATRAAMERAAALS